MARPVGGERNPLDKKSTRSAMSRKMEFEAKVQRTEIGFRIRDLREKSGITQEETADQLGFHRSYLSEVENGKRDVPVVILTRIAKHFKVSLDFLITGVLQ